MKLEFPGQIFEYIPNFMKIRSVGAELLRADGLTDTQTDMTKLIDDFGNFAKAP